MIDDPGAAAGRQISANPVVGAAAAAKITGTGATLSPDAAAVSTGTADISTLTSAGGTLVLIAFSGAMGRGLTATFAGLIANAHQFRTDGGGLLALTSRIGSEVIASVALAASLSAIRAPATLMSAAAPILVAAMVLRPAPSARMAAAIAGASLVLSWGCALGVWLLD